MRSLIRSVLREELGQDVAEYALVITFTVVTLMALAVGFKSSIAGVTNVSNSQLQAAHTAARY